MVAMYEPAVAIKTLRAELFDNEQPIISDSERRDKNMFRMSMGDRAPAFAFCAYSMGLDLVQERVYSDVVEGRHMAFFARSVDTYEQVCAQLRPLVRQLKERNAPLTPGNRRFQVQVQVRDATHVRAASALGAFGQSQDVHLRHVQF